MNKNTNIIFRTILLLGGLAIIAAAFYLFEGSTENLSDQHKFLWISIVISYLVLFLPLYFPPKFSEDTGGAFIGYGLLSLNALFFIGGVIVSVVISFCVETYGMKIAVILFLVSCLSFLASIYLSALTGSHIDSVQAKEKNLLSSVKEIKEQVKMLSVKMNTLGDDFNECKKQYEKLSDKILYISPVDNNENAARLEKQIKDMLTEIAFSSFTSPDALSKQIAGLEQIVDMRKTILN